MKKKSQPRKAKSPSIVQMMYDAVPGPKAPKEDGVGGAYVIAFHRASTVPKAVIAELESALEGGWLVQSMQEAQIRLRSEMQDKPSRESYDEARKNGVCRRFFCYPETKTPTKGPRTKSRSKKTTRK